MKAYGRSRKETHEYPDLADLSSMGGCRNGNRPSIRSAKARASTRRRFKKQERLSAKEAVRNESV